MLRLAKSPDGPDCYLIYSGQGCIGTLRWNAHFELWCWEMRLIPGPPLPGEGYRLHKTLDEAKSAIRAHVREWLAYVDAKPDE